MESKQFSKLIKECKLIDKKFTNNDFDIFFAKLKVKGQKTIAYPGLDRAISEIAAKKGTTKDAVTSIIQKYGAAPYKGTKADYVKFQDYKN